MEGEEDQIKSCGGFFRRWSIRGFFGVIMKSSFCPGGKLERVWIHLLNSPLVHEITRGSRPRSHREGDSETETKHEGKIKEKRKGVQEKKGPYLMAAVVRNEVGAGTVARDRGTSGTSPRSGSKRGNPGPRLRRSPDSEPDAGDGGVPIKLVVQRILIMANWKDQSRNRKKVFV